MGTGVTFFLAQLSWDDFIIHSVFYVLDGLFRVAELFSRRYSGDLIKIFQVVFHGVLFQVSTIGFVSDLNGVLLIVTNGIVLIMSVFFEFKFVGGVLIGHGLRIVD